ncbi:hypothetical protein KY290_010550 [Solanum tuberosum]|uniref:DUF4216 domain-containing protein n=1 Tax=Solanum tuberosum TaxID=4113 RepID=A0ABQ7W043_SOLTU|nr:hypothetical protein KY290_010550 [Solanum tuberosum]
MYKRLTKGLYDPEFVRGVQHFIEFAMSHPEGRDGERLRKLKKYEPFVLAMQAAQMYYASYPRLLRDKSDWWAVCKTQSRGIVVMSPSYLSSPLVDVAKPFEFDGDGLRFDVVYDNETIVRNDPNGEFINLRDENDDLDDETEFYDVPESKSDDENENEEAYYESGIMAPRGVDVADILEKD